MYRGTSIKLNLIKLQIRARDLVNKPPEEPKTSKCIAPAAAALCSVSPRA